MPAKLQRTVCIKIRCQNPLDKKRKGAVNLKPQKTRGALGREAVLRYRVTVSHGSRRFQHGFVSKVFPLAWLVLWSCCPQQEEATPNPTTTFNTTSNNIEQLSSKCVGGGGGGGGGSGVSLFVVVVTREAVVLSSKR